MSLLKRGERKKEPIDVHLAIGLDGRNRMIKETQIKYKNITPESSCVSARTRLLKKEKLWKVIWKHKHSKWRCLPERYFFREKLAILGKYRGQMLRIMLGVIMEVDLIKNFYKIGTKDGILNSLHTRNQLTTCTEGSVKISDVRSINVSVREYAGKASLFFGQGYRRCNCKTSCRNNFCSCIKSKKLCNCKRHNSLPCENRWHLCLDKPCFYIYFCFSFLIKWCNEKFIFAVVFFSKEKTSVYNWIIIYPFFIPSLLYMHIPRPNLGILHISWKFPVIIHIFWLMC